MNFEGVYRCTKQTPERQRSSKEVGADACSEERLRGSAAAAFSVGSRCGNTRLAGCVPLSSAVALLLYFSFNELEIFWRMCRRFALSMPREIFVECQCVAVVVFIVKACAGCDAATLC